MNQIIKTETQGEFLGVAGRFYNVVANTETGKILNQKFVSFSRKFVENGQKLSISFEAKFDSLGVNQDEYFSITGMIKEDSMRGRDVSGGCIHDDIAKHFPEVADVLKFHLFHKNEKNSYIKNTVYLAGDRDHNGFKKGEPCQWADGLVFGNSPIVSYLPVGFIEFCLSADLEKIEPLAVEHGEDKTGYKFEPKYTLKGFDCKWYQCAFDTLADASNFCEALKLGAKRVKVATKFSSGKARDLDGARSSSLWFDATDEELSQEREELEKALLERLPKVFEEFKNTVGKCGFLFDIK